MTARILYVITKADLGGAQTHLLDLVTHFMQECEVLVVCGELGPLVDRLHSLGVAIEILPAMGRNISPMKDIRALLGLIRVVRHFAPSLIHAHSSKAGLISRLAAAVCRVPVVYTAHGWGFAPGTPKTRSIVVWLSELLCSFITDKVIAVSEFDRKLAEKKLRLRSDRLVCVHNGISNAAPVAVPLTTPPIFVMVARFKQPKEQLLLLKAFDAANIDGELLFVGSGPTRPACEKYASRLQSRDRTRFLGERRDVPELLAAAHVFVLLSRHEGLPISIIEAMRAGLPIIASAVGGIPELVRHETNGFLIPRDDISALILAIRKLANEPCLRSDLGTESRRLFATYFSVDTMIDQTRAVYRELIETDGEEHLAVRLVPAVAREETSQESARA